MIDISRLNLSYKDVSLISRQISAVRSRDDIKLDVELMPGLNLTVPIISSPMVDVTDVNIAKIMHSLGGISILHRFQSIEEQLCQYKEIDPYKVICAVGLDDFDRIKALYMNGCRYFCLDVANGANIRVKEFLEELNLRYGGLYFIVGNVVSLEQFGWCSRLPGVSAIRVGVAGGSACSTKKMTGVYHGMISLLNEIKQSNPYEHIKIIADGGVNRPADYCKSLIFGADAVIIGGLIAACNESPAKWSTDQHNRLGKEYHGSASFVNQKRYKGEPKYIEGKTILLQPEGSLIDLIDRFGQGLRSSMSYFNATNLKTYRKNCDFKINILA